MPADFTSLRNHYEQPVLNTVIGLATSHPDLDRELLPDVACVALNRLPARYIRHQADLAFYLTEQERQDSDRLVHEAVSHAFEFVKARVAARARS